MYSTVIINSKFFRTKSRKIKIEGVTRGEFASNLEITLVSFPKKLTSLLE